MKYRRNLAALAAVVLIGGALFIALSYTSWNRSAPIHSSLIDKAQALESADSDDSDRPQELAEDSLRLSFIDVGQAHALLIQKGSTDILVDAGRHYSRNLPAAMDTITDSVDLLFITHPHADHFGGAAGLLEAHQVDKIITNGIRRGPPMDRSVPATWNTFEEAADKANLELQSWEAGHGEQITEHLSIEVLATGGDFDSRNSSQLNDDSLVLLIKYGDRRILLPGDIEVAGGRMLVDRYCPDGPSDCPALRADIMKVPHHGSSHFHPEFFKAVSPGVSVFGAPHDNRQHYHPRRDTLRALVDLGSRIKSTNQGGGKNVEVIISPAGELTWNIDDPEIFVWDDHGAEYGTTCRLIVDETSRKTSKECESHRTR